MSQGKTLLIDIGDHELLVRHRYQALSIANDILIALWFIAGSILFFSDSTATAATWLFLLGSIELLLRPAVRLTRLTHLRRLGTTTDDPDDEY